MPVNVRRVAITGMAINTTLGDTLDGYLGALLKGRSGITRWTAFDAGEISSKIGGDLTPYDVKAKLARLEQSNSVPPAISARAKRLVAKAPWSVRLSILLATDAWADAGLFETEMTGRQPGAIVSGCHLLNSYHASNLRTFDKEPDYIDPLYAVQSLETTHAACVSDVLSLRGTGMVVSAACASGLYSLRSAVDEIRWHNAPAVVVVGAVPDFAPVDLHALALIGALSQDSFNDEPERASRPFDVRREGFVPAHGGGAVVLEDFDRATARGARIYGEVLGVETNADASYLPQPSEEGQARAMKEVLQSCEIAPEEIDYINGHFTSTPLGDLAEISAIKSVFGDHAYRLKANATKSMIGHTMGASAMVELIGAVLQMRAGQLHQTINIDELDAAVDLDVCAAGPVDYEVRTLMKNAFGFGGLNASAIVAASPKA